jgi:hypothetical protein
METFAIFEFYKQLLTAWYFIWVKLTKPSPKRYIASLTPLPQNIFFFIYRMFPEVIG